MVTTWPKEDGSPLPKPSPQPNTVISPAQPNKRPNFSPAETAVHRSPLLSPALTKTTPAKQVKTKSGAAGFSPRTPVRDDESLTSCPPFLVPNYMVPTFSAKAKVRAYVGSPRDRPAEGAAAMRAQPRKRMSLGQSIGPFRWGKGTSNIFLGMDSASQRMSGTLKPMHAIGNISVDSTTSLPAGLGRRPFKFK